MVLVQIAKIIGSPLWKPNVSNEERLSEVKCHLALIDGVLGFVDLDGVPDNVRNTIMISRKGFGEIEEDERDIAGGLTDVLFEIINESKYSSEVIVDTCKFVILDFITDYDENCDIEEVISDFRKCNAFCMIMDDVRDDKE